MKILQLDFWTHPSLIRPTDIRVGPKDYPDLMSKLTKQGFNVTVIHDDVQKWVVNCFDIVGNTNWLGKTWLGWNIYNQLLVELF